MSLKSAELYAIWSYIVTITAEIAQNTHDMVVHCDHISEISGIVYDMVRYGHNSSKNSDN